MGAESSDLNTPLTIDPCDVPDESEIRRFGMMDTAPIGIETW